ncbi:geranylgeranylglyceryl/heptaprenylglyceryl phosphate synthase [Cecembia lonarensis]|uniref:Geranylgeranylglyceryl phosphate synthase n=1 Tax=Cecembia lonarensis (strain CCUG 58316 / KCTC 22772 / LW9) TaxID=1225176 RepID=K1L3H4_CECL9|nr:geranylgeranylglyceryl/heptaprenylglyceryl phosphate synthase [Cecembia lonarensis]EKB49376.1 geranylgeranylglyceryl phosphate synthase-like protein [Cecembia lonarensis LW9]
MKGEVASGIQTIYKSGQKGLAWLIDPDDWDELLPEKLKEIQDLKVDFIFIGGSLIQQDNVTELIKMIRENVPHLPIVIFPGNALQFSPNADALLFLSLISGRNPDLLIGQHVAVAPLIEKSNIEVLPTGYLLIDGGKRTSVHYMSQTIPLPNHSPELTVATALAGYYLGLKYFYLDAGSGAAEPVNPKIIKAMKKRIAAPLLVGGGLNNIEKIRQAYLAGADIVVIGNGAEKSIKLLKEVSDFLESIRVLSN